MAGPKVHVFVDNPNVFISAKDVAEKREGHAARHQVRLQIDHMIKLALAGRGMGRPFVVGSVPPEQRAVWDRYAKATGVKPELYERGQFSGGEQGLDQCLQVHRLRAMSDFAEDPQIAVLMTGDGAGYDDGVGFHADMERMHKAGWGIEVISWQSHCRKALREWAVKNGVFVSLDDYYEAVTFLEGQRPSKALDLSKRQVTTARAGPAKFAEERAQKAAAAQIAELERQLKEVQEAKALKDKRREKYERRYARVGEKLRR